MPRKTPKELIISEIRDYENKISDDSELYNFEIIYYDEDMDIKQLTSIRDEYKSKFNSRIEELKDLIRNDESLLRFYGKKDHIIPKYTYNNKSLLLVHNDYLDKIKYAKAEYEAEKNNAISAKVLQQELLKSQRAKIYDKSIPVEELFPDDEEKRKQVLEIRENCKTVTNTNTNKSSRVGSFAGFFITITPEDSIFDLKLLIEKMIPKDTRKNSGIEKVIYCFEQTGTDSSTSGKLPHVHMIIWRSNSSSQMSQKAKLLGSINSYFRKYLSVMKIDAYDDNLLRQKLKYITGEKCQQKMPKVEQDKIWRKEVNLEDLYVIDYST